MQAQPSIIAKNYWYYSNDTYELESIVDSDQQVEYLKRSIIGPIPYEDVCDLVRGKTPIDPMAHNWQALVVARLAKHRFVTKNIIQHVPFEYGVTFKGYVKSFINWKTANKITLTAVSVTLVLVSPNIIAKLAPNVAKILGLGTESAELFIHFKEQWQKLFALTLGSSSLVNYHLSCLCAGYVSFKLFNKLNETLGPKNFELWKASKMQILIREGKDTLIPDTYYDDAVLSQHVCAISQLPIRVPCRTPYGHIFEDVMIRCWLAQQIAHGVNPPQCPLRNGSLLFTDLKIDYALSDQIELRLLLLDSQ